jgi:hypothetical protein
MNELPAGLCAPPQPPSRLRLLKKRSREPTATNPQDRVDALASAFVQTQQRAHPLAVGLFFGDEPPPDSLAKLASRFAEKPSPEAAAAMNIYRKIRSGEMVIVED